MGEQDEPAGPAMFGAVDPGVDSGQGKLVHQLLNHLRQASFDTADVWQFLAFAMPLARRSKAQLFQDLWALWVSGGKLGGYFVEFGAADGVHLSNTYLLEKEWGWSGVLAEPHPAFQASLRRERRCALSSKCVYSTSGRTLEFIAARAGEYSRISSIEANDQHEAKRQRSMKVVQVETISLNDLLSEHRAPKRIDFMSVDTEGSELEILAAFDFGRWDVRALAVEHGKRPIRGQLHELLSAKGYERRWPGLSRFDDWYVKRD